MIKYRKEATDLNRKKFEWSNKIYEFNFSAAPDKSISENFHKFYHLDGVVEVLNELLESISNAQRDLLPSPNQLLLSIQISSQNR